jgi:hypothetical protein
MPLSCSRRRAILRRRRGYRRKKVVLARYACNDRLADALHQQAFCALTA